jgi:peptide/nickel transport system permease protein
VVTVLALYLGQMMAGAVLTETVFSWPGLGRLMFDSIGSRDYPLVLGLFLFISVIVIVSNLIADLLYAFLDPRVRYR